MLKLALRNIKSKPWRTIATIVSIGVAVAMIFAMLSFKNAVFDFISASETAISGNSDIKISAQSSSDRITQVTSDLESVEGIKTITPSLYLYAELAGEYVQARGFEAGKFEVLQKIDAVKGKSTENLKADDVVISEAAAKHFKVDVGDRLELKLGANSVNLYVGAIAKNVGYFLDDSPYLILGAVRQISALVIPGEVDLCNEIYISSDGTRDANDIISDIQALAQYAEMRVELSHDYKYVLEQTNAYTAPVILAGGAVLVLAIAIVAFVLLMGEKDKIDYIARLSIVGATRKQIFAIFLIESVVLAFAGGLVGSGLAVGIFALILKLTLKTTILNVSAIYLFASATIGIVVTILSALYPIFRSLKSTIRQNQVATKKQQRFGFLLPIGIGLSLFACVLIEAFLEIVTPYFAIVSMVLTLALIFAASPYILKIVAKLMRKVNLPSVQVATKSLPREKRFARSTSILTAGIAISVMLFMAWNITTSMFDGFIKNFEDFVFVSNIKSTVDINGFKSIDGVETATKMVWQTVEIEGDGFQKTSNLLGSYDVLNMVNFEFITPKSQVKSAIVQDELSDSYTSEPYVLVDLSMQKLYGVKVGDNLEMSVKDKNVNVRVNGNYIIMSSEALKEFGIEVDTVLVVANKDVDATVGNIKQKYASQNYYAVSAIEAYKWEKESSSALFDLVGTLAVVVAILIFIVATFAALVGRGSESRNRTALLNAGLSKNGLMSAEVFEHVMIALTAFLLAFAASLLLTFSLIHALMLFGLYFEFVYSAWVVALVGASMAAAYSLVPFMFNFKKDYKLKRE